MSLFPSTDYSCEWLQKVARAVDWLVNAQGCPRTHSAVPTNEVRIFQKWGLAMTSNAGGLRTNSMHCRSTRTWSIWGCLTHRGKNMYPYSSQRGCAWTKGPERTTLSRIASYCLTGGSKRTMCWTGVAHTKHSTSSHPCFVLISCNGTIVIFEYGETATWSYNRLAWFVVHRLIAMCACLLFAVPGGMFVGAASGDVCVVWVLRAGFVWL